MARLGKKTLYLDLDALDRLEAALSRLPGRPSLSSYLSDQLVNQAELIEKLVDALETGGLRGMAAVMGVYGDVGQQAEKLQEDIKETLRTAKNPDKPLSEIVKDVPPKKARKSSSKKVVKT